MCTLKHGWSNYLIRKPFKAFTLESDVEAAITVNEWSWTFQQIKETIKEIANYVDWISYKCNAKQFDLLFL